MWWMSNITGNAVGKARPRQIGLYSVSNREPRDIDKQELS